MGFVQTPTIGGWAHRQKNAQNLYEFELVFLVNLGGQVAQKTQFFRGVPIPGVFPPEVVWKLKFSEFDTPKTDQNPFKLDANLCHLRIRPVCIEKLDSKGGMTFGIIYHLFRFPYYMLYLFRVVHLESTKTAHGAFSFFLCFAFCVFIDFFPGPVLLRSRYFTKPPKNKGTFVYLCENNKRPTYQKKNILSRPKKHGTFLNKKTHPFVEPLPR